MQVEDCKFYKLCYNEAGVKNQENDPMAGRVRQRRNIDYPAMVRRMRETLGVSQEALARELGVSFPTLNRWENGVSHPSPLARRRLAEFQARVLLRKRR